MPNIKSNKKNLRKTIKRSIENRSVLSKIRTQFKKVVKLIETNQVEGIDKEVSFFFKYADKAVKKGTIKKNNAARKKSELYKKVSLLQKKSVES